VRFNTSIIDSTLNNIGQKRSGRHCKYKPKELILLTQTDSHSVSVSECDTQSHIHIHIDIGLGSSVKPALKYTVYAPHSVTVAETKAFSKIKRLTLLVLLNDYSLLLLGALLLLDCNYS